MEPEWKPVDQAEVKRAVVAIANAMETEKIEIPIALCAMEFMLSEAKRSGHMVKHTFKDIEDKV